MTFKNLMQDTVCDCLANSFIDNETTFAIKTNKDKLRDADFKTYWEKGRRPDIDTCEDICSIKGQSLNIVSDENDYNQTIEIYKELFPLSPGYKPHCTVITLLENSGRVKATPLPNNSLHHDFYKSDVFNLDMIKFHTTVYLADV